MFAKLLPKKINRRRILKFLVFTVLLWPSVVLASLASIFGDYALWRKILGLAIAAVVFIPSWWSYFQWVWMGKAEHIFSIRGKPIIGLTFDDDLS